MRWRLPECEDFPSFLDAPEPFILHGGPMSVQEYWKVWNCFQKSLEWRGHVIYEISEGFFRQDENFVDVTIKVLPKTA